MQSLDREAPALVGDMRQTNEDARAMLHTATQTLRDLQGLASRDGEVGNSLLKTLEEMRDAARSIRIMAEYLERHPEALLKGKGGKP